VGGAGPRDRRRPRARGCPAPGRRGDVGGAGPRDRRPSL